MGADRWVMLEFTIKDLDVDLLKSPRYLAALRRAGRTAIVAFAGLSIGIWGLQNANVAVFATFSAFALLGIADFGGSH